MVPNVHGDVAAGLIGWVVLAFIAWQLFKWVRRHGGGSVAVAQADAQADSDAAATGGKAQAGVIVNVYMASDARHGTQDADGFHVSIPEAIESAALPSLPPAQVVASGQSGNGVRASVRSRKASA